MRDKRRYLFVCSGCGKVFSCNGGCEKKVGKTCQCEKCLPLKVGCDIREETDPRLVLLAKLKKGTWIRIEEDEEESKTTN